MMLASIILITYFVSTLINLSSLHPVSTFRNSFKENHFNQERKSETFYGNTGHTQRLHFCWKCISEEVPRNPQQACWAQILSNTEKLIQISLNYSQIFKISFMLSTLSSFQGWSRCVAKLFSSFLENKARGDKRVGWRKTGGKETSSGHVSRGETWIYFLTLLANNLKMEAVVSSIKEH